MTILVTGASGFLGSHVAEQLAQAGRKVRLLVRTSSDTRFLRTLKDVELVEGAVNDRESVLSAVQGVSAIIHSAGLVNYWVWLICTYCRKVRMQQTWFYPQNFLVC